MKRSGGHDIVYLPLGAAAFGGAERSLIELAAAQQAAGKRVLVAYEAALDGTDFIAQAQALNLPLHRVGWAPDRGLMAVLAAAWRFFGAVEAPLLHFNISWRSNMWAVALLARLRSRARLVGSMRAMPERYEDVPRKRHFGVLPGLQLWKLPDLLMGRTWAALLHATVSVNRDDYPPRLVREFGFAPGRLSVIYNGVRIPERVPSDAERAQARAVLGWPADAFIVAYVGRVSQEKGVGYAIEALCRCDPRVHLLVAGDGNDVDAVHAQARQLGLAERVRLLGYVPQPTAVFTPAHAAVVPSLWNEAFGRVVVEAMACGLPIVATAVGGMQELFDDGVHGWFVPKADAAALAAAFDRLLADPLRRRTMGRAARTLAAERYAVARVAAEYAALYERVAHA